MPLSYTKAEPVILRGNPAFSEAWLQERIAEDPSIIGLGEIELIARERRQEKAGRLDLLLFDRRENTRYEVELMLGATDESHIIRALEYWDIERRRYPAYDHCAVIVAENITGRFINILSLFAGTVPLIAIQLSALKVGEQIVLNFVRVLDRFGLREDDESESAGPPVDRDYWLNKRVTGATIGFADALLDEINKRAKSPYRLNYLKDYIGLTDGNRSTNFVLFIPRKQSIDMYIRVNEPQPLSQKFLEAGIDSEVKNDGRLWVSVRPKTFEEGKAVLTETMSEAVTQFEAE